MALGFMFYIGKSPMVTILFASFLCISAFVFVMVCPVLAILTILSVMIVRPVLWLAEFFRPTARGLPQPPDPLPNQGLDERALCSIPRVTHRAAVDARLTECAICLMEFVDGDVIRMLPYCRHGFHINCINQWLKYRSSCPSCREIVVLEEICHK